WGGASSGTIVRGDRLRHYFSDFMVDVPKEFETETGLFVWDIFSFTIRCPLCSGFFQRKPRSICRNDAIHYVAINQYTYYAGCVIPDLSLSTSESNSPIDSITVR